MATGPEHYRAVLEVVTADRVYEIRNAGPDVGDLIRDILAGFFTTVNMSNDGGTYKIPVRDIREITIRL